VGLVDKSIPDSVSHSGRETSVSGGVHIQGVSDLVEIGRGGFGVVYRASETDLQRTVAVKLLTGEFDEDSKRRFDRERKAMGALSGHPNIVTVYRAGLTENERPYLIMEYMSGGSIAERLVREGPVPWQRAVEIGIELAGALDVAHQGGVLHRDIKPGNLLISSRGTVKLGDFGIARMVGAPETRSAVITASLAHAAPEIIAGRRPDERADLYSLVSTLYEMIRGRPPFINADDESLVPMLARIAQDPVPSLAGVGVPPAVDAVLAKGMAKEPADRQQSLSEFAAELQRAIGRGSPAQVTTVIPVARESMSGIGAADTAETSSIEVSSPAEPIASIEAAAPFEPDESTGLFEAVELNAPVAPGEQPRRPDPVGDTDALGLLAPPAAAEPAPQSRKSLMMIGGAVATVVVLGIAGFAISQAGGSDERAPVAVAGLGTTLPSETTVGTSISTSTSATTATTAAPTTTTSRPPTTTTTLVTTTTTANTTTTAPVDSGTGIGIGSLVPGAGGEATAPTGPDYPAYDVVTDGVGGITVEVPSEWVDRQTQPGVVLASPNIAAALSDYSVSGVAITALRSPIAIDHDLGLDGYVEDGCNGRQRVDYDDGLYTGRADIWSGCGGAGLSEVLRISASPADDSLWVVVSVQLVEERDVAASARIIRTFLVNVGNLP
jgi:serine/threonine protein kinase